jgi:hypothetical protein
MGAKKETRLMRVIVNGCNRSDMNKRHRKRWDFFAGFTVVGGKKRH